MNEQPLISVLMTAYNRENFLGEAIESVLASTYTNFELIIVDDCSKDNTVDIAINYAKNDKRIKLYVNERNLGDYPNRNKAATYAAGELIMYVDSDDTIEPDAIQYIVEWFTFYPEADFGTIYQGSNLNTPELIQSVEGVRKHFNEAAFLIHGPGGTVIKNSYFKMLGGFPELYGPANDMYYNIKAAASSQAVLLLPYNYLNYRRHDGQEINNRFSYLYNGYLYFRDVMALKNLPLNDKERKRLIKKNKRRFVVNIIRYVSATGNFRNAIKAIKLTRFGFKDFYHAIVN